MKMKNHPEPILMLGVRTVIYLSGYIHYLRLKNGHKVLDQKETTILASPLLVSTIDYLIAAGEP